MYNFFQEMLNRKYSKNFVVFIECHSEEILYTKVVQL